MERAYKRICFHGRGIVARWLDRGFFAAVCGVCLYILEGKAVLSLLLFGAAALLFLLWDMRRWDRFKRKLWRSASDQLRREAWLDQEAERIRRAGGVVVYPSPDADSFLGLCLRMGPGASFHCFGDPQEKLTEAASAVGCSISFHPWGAGEAPSRAQVEARLERDAPKKTGNVWRSLLALPANRYLLVGFLLLALSMLLRHALYWRLLGSLCLMIGAARRSFRGIGEK